MNDAIVLAKPSIDKAAARRQKAEARQKQARKKASKAPEAARSSSVRISNDSNAPAERFSFVFGPQEKAIHDYLRCVFKPSEYVARVPASRGSFELYTDLWRTSESGSVVAGSDGTAVLGVCAPNWVESGNASGTPNAYSQVVGYTDMGSASIASVGGATAYGYQFPTLGASFSAAWKGVILDRPTDSAMNATTRIRLVAMELRIHSVMAATASKGEVMLCGSVNPLGGIRAGSLNGSNWDDIVKTNGGVMTRAIRALPNWKSGEIFSIVAIPAEDQAFEMCTVGATGVSAPSFGGGPLVPLLNIGLLARSMTPDDIINYEITYVWESELAKSNVAETSSRPVVGIPASTLNTAMASARPLAIHNQMAGIHALPFVETLANTNPNGLAALARMPGLKRPSVSPSAQSSGAVVHHVPETGWFSQLINGGKALHKVVTNSGLLSAIPVVGGPLQAVASVLSKLFD